jgi:hypothetical protein
MIYSIEQNDSYSLDIIASQDFSENYLPLLAEGRISRDNYVSREWGIELDCPSGRIKEDYEI